MRFVSTVGGKKPVLLPDIAEAFNILLEIFAEFLAKS